MKILVENMTKTGKGCPFSEWEPYPPIIGETGRYVCTRDKKDCNANGKKCRWLKEAKEKENE